MLENTKNYEDVSEKRSINYKEVERALPIVRKFIVSKQRILYGGMAIDLSLKAAKQDGIYKDDAIPDYDFMSPDFYNDSNELAIILQKEGFTNVSSINALHLTSRRVRVNFVPVADITYIPQSIYEKLPTIKVKDLKVIHPDFQRLDMHRAFNIPFENPPMEVVMHRFKKDQTRFRLLDAAYPIMPPDQKFDYDTKKQTTIVMSKEYLVNGVIGGLAAYGLMYQCLEAMLKEYLPEEEMPDIAKVEVEGSKTDLKVSFPAAWPIMTRFNILTDDFPTLAEKISKKTKTEPEYHNRYLDNIRPRAIYIDSGNEWWYEIFDVKGTLLPCYLVEDFMNLYNSKQAPYFKNMRIVQPQYLAMYFLQKSFGTNQPLKTMCYRYLYQSVLKLVETAEKLAPIAKEKNTYEKLPFYLTVNTYGTQNWSSDYVYSVKDKLYTINGILPAQRPALRPVFGFYPERGDAKWPEFDPSQSELFQIDGAQRTEPFEPVTLDI